MQYPNIVWRVVRQSEFVCKWEAIIFMTSRDTPKLSPILSKQCCFKILNEQMDCCYNNLCNFFVLLLTEEANLVRYNTNGQKKDWF